MILYTVFSIKVKTALVTGGSTGIGLMATVGLVSAGAKVFIVSRKLENCQSAANELNNYGFEGEVIPFRGDLSSEAGINNITNINCVIGSKKFSTRYLIDGFRFIPSDEGQRNFSETVSSNLPEFQIETVTLKDIFSNNKNGNQEIYKIDTEGHQCTFIPPFADDLCSRNAILLMELDSPQRMSEFGKTNQDVLDPFFKNGYTGFWLDHRTVNTKVKEFKSIDSEMDKNSLAIMIPPKYLDSKIYK